MLSMSDPVPIHQHALNNLRYIREAMERASAFTSIPGWGGVGVGITPTIAAVVAQRFIARREWIYIWLGEAVLAAILAGVTMAIKARRANVSFTGGPARRFFMSYFAPIVAAAVLTILLARIGARSAMPATWLLLYGASFIGGPARRFFMSYFAPIVAAAVLTILLARIGARSAMPATWLLLYGASFI